MQRKKNVTNVKSLEKYNSSIFYNYFPINIYIYFAISKLGIQLNYNNNGFCLKRSLIFCLLFGFKRENERKREREREHELGWGEGDFLKGVDIGKRI